MKFSVEKINESVVSLVRRLGYAPLGSEGDEFSCVRNLGQGRGGYPRFHLFIKQGDAHSLIFNLHLDQKKPSYKGVSAHSGEYEGEVTEKEKQRIMSIIQGLR